MGFLLDLLDHYTSNILVKSINISLLKTKFLLLISRQNFNTTNNIAHINGGKVQPYSIFKHYHHKDLCFLQLFLYEYYKIVSIDKHERKQDKDYKLDDTYTKREMFV